MTSQQSTKEQLRQKITDILHEGCDVVSSIDSLVELLSENLVLPTEQSENNISKADYILDGYESVNVYVDIDQPEPHYHKDFVLAAMIEYAKQFAGGRKDVLKELIDIRNKLYEELPTGEKIDAFELLQMIKWHLNDVDNFCSRFAAMEHYRNQSTGLREGEVKDLHKRAKEYLDIHMDGDLDLHLETMILDAMVDFKKSK